MYHYPLFVCTPRLDPRIARKPRIEPPLGAPITTLEPIFSTVKLFHTWRVSWGPQKTCDTIDNYLVFNITEAWIVLAGSGYGECYYYFKVQYVVCTYIGRLGNVVSSLGVG